VSEWQRQSQREEIEARAAAWLAQRDDAFTDEDRAEFERWCAEDPAHAAAVARLERVWESLRELRDFRPEARAHPDPDLLAPHTAPQRLRFPRGPVLAAAAAIAVLATFWLKPAAHHVGSTVAAEETYSTAVGGFQRVSLADGSVVELNASSEVHVRYTKTERHATLLRGEAHFSVASNAQRPFWVEAKNVAVRAVGTAFDVRLDRDNVEVLVTAGRVRVDRDAVPLTLAGNSVLSAGWRAVVSPHGAVASATKLAGDSVRELLSWQSSKLVFVDTPLSEVVEEFNRRNQVQLILADSELGALPIGGSFSAENVESFVRLLASNGDIRVELRIVVLEGALHVLLSVAELDVRFEAVKQGGRDADESFAGVPVRHRADGLVDSEDFLDNNNGAYRLAGRRCHVCVEVMPVPRLQCDPITHRSVRPLADKNDLALW